MTDAPHTQDLRPLLSVDILEALPPEETERLDARFETVHLEAGDLLTIDEERQRVYVLVSGRARVYGSSPKGHEITFSVVEGGTVLYQTGFASRTSPALCAHALERSVVRVLGWSDFDDLVRRNPEVALRTIRLLNTRLGGYEVRLSELVRKEVPARLASLILRLSEQRGAPRHDNDRKVPARYTHQQLASMIGANREAVTRALKSLREVGTVAVEGGRICVTDLGALHRIADVER